jgi:hypothetical protein
MLFLKVLNASFERIEKVVWEHKPMLLLSTSPDVRGAKSVLEIANARFSYESSLKIPVFSLPSFYQNFDPNTGITNTTLNAEFKESLHLFENQLSLIN